MNSGKPFDCQSASALQADASLTGLSFACQRILVTCLPMHPCCLLADVSLSFACQHILVTCLPMHPCCLLADVSLLLACQCILVICLLMCPCRLLADMSSTQTCHHYYEFREAIWLSIHPVHCASFLPAWCWPSSTKDSLPDWKMASSYPTLFD